MSVKPRKAPVTLRVRHRSMKILSSESEQKSWCRSVFGPPCVLGGGSGSKPQGRWMIAHRLWLAWLGGPTGRSWST